VSSINRITSEKLSRLIGTPKCAALVDVRSDEEFAADPRLIPGSSRRDYMVASTLTTAFAGQPVVVICRDGQAVSPGVAAWLRNAGAMADTLEGGFEGWVSARFPVLSTRKLPKPDPHGRTVWVTRERPKIDRIACPWLIRRFIDPQAAFLFVAPADVAAVAERFAATPYDVEGVFFSHRGDRCTFDILLAEFGLETEPLKRLATIVRGADTARLDLAPEAPGLLAVSLGLSRMYANDLEQLEAGTGIYDALYRWCRDATGETHNWPAAAPKRPATVT